MDLFEKVRYLAMPMTDYPKENASRNVRNETMNASFSGSEDAGDEVPAISRTEMTRFNIQMRQGFRIYRGGEMRTPRQYTHRKTITKKCQVAGAYRTPGLLKFAVYPKEKMQPL